MKVPSSDINLELAALIAVLSLATISVALFLMRPFISNLRNTISEAQFLRPRLILPFTIILAAIVFLENRISIYAGIGWPSGFMTNNTMLWEVITYCYIAMTLIWCMPLFFKFFIGLVGRGRSTPIMAIRIRMHKLFLVIFTLTSYWACIYIIASIVCASLALILISSSALGYEIISIEGYEQGRWILLNGICCLTSGIVIFGGTYIWYYISKELL